MIREKAILLIVVLFVFNKIGNAGVGLTKLPSGVKITFEFQESKDPIGCVYLDTVFLTRLTPREIQSGEVVVDSARFSKRLRGKTQFRVGVFIEGYVGDGLIRKIQAANFSAVNFYTYQSEAIIEGKLQEFVFRRFNELRNIRANIKKEGALWKADLTTVFMMPDEERAKLCGFRAPETEGSPIPPQPKDSGRQFPPYFDWTNKDGINWMTRVKEQGAAGTCWAFAAVGEVEAVVNITTNTPNPNFDLAEQTLVTDCCRYCGDGDGGTNFSALHYIKKHGIPFEQFDPYTATNGPCCKRPAKLWKISSYTRITWHDTSATTIKGALQNHPLSSSVYAPTSGPYSWYAYTGGVYSYGGSPATAPNHAIIFVGWNDNDEGGTKTWKIKNSWGDDWGENGYMRLIRGQNNLCGWYTYDVEYQPGN